MKRILSVRKSEKKGGSPGEFVGGADRAVRTKIVNLVGRGAGEDFDFLVEEDGVKSVRTAGDLLGEVVNIVDDTCLAEFVEGEDGQIEVNISLFEGALPREETVRQLKALRKKTKGIDIGDRISDMSKQGANIAYVRNPIDKGVESMEDYWRSGKKFKPNRHLKAFKEFK
jgi:predicted DNA-binding protein